MSFDLAGAGAHSGSFREKICAVFDPTLRRPVVYTIAFRYQTPLLARGSIGAITAWAHNRSSLLDLLIARDIPRAELGLVLVVIHLWSAFLQAMTDSGWYAPGRGLLLRGDGDGPGMPDGVLADPTTSLAVMVEHLRGYSGSLAFSPRPGGGTRACVRWQSRARGACGYMGHGTFGTKNFFLSQVNNYG